VDGVTVAELREYQWTHWETVKEQLRSGTYKPAPIRRVEIPKPGVGVRLLGIPTVLDRFLQQALLQVMTPTFDGGFSRLSFGFRPGKRVAVSDRANGSADRALRVPADAKRGPRAEVSFRLYGLPARRRLCRLPQSAGRHARRLLGACAAQVRRSAESVARRSLQHRNGAHEGLAFCNELFAIERELKDASPEQRHAVCLERSKPVSRPIEKSSK